MSFESELQAICKEVQGCQAAILMNIEGLMVANHIVDASGVDAETLLVELTTALKQVVNAVKMLEAGTIDDMTLNFSKGVLLLRFLNDEYFVAALMNPSAVAGRGRFALRQHSLALGKELY